MNRDLAVSDSEALKKAVAWDTQKRLEFVLPFQDLKPSVFLGRYVCMYICTYVCTYACVMAFAPEELLLLLVLTRYTRPQCPAAAATHTHKHLTISPSAHSHTT